MACLFAARLASHTQVAMLGTWDEGLEALRKNGVRLVDLNGSELNFPVKVTCDPGELPSFKFALVLVKSWQTSRAAIQLQNCLAEDGIALTLQNGLGNLERLRQVLGPERATLGVTTLGATLLDPGYVRVGGIGPTYVVPTGRMAGMMEILRLAGFEIEQVEDLDGLIWGKLAINAGINPLTALLHVPNGELLKRPDARHLMLEAARETASVALAKGIKLSPEDPVSQVEKVAVRTATNHSSMYQDIQRGAPTEINVICGEIVKEGKRLRVPTPVNETFWHLIRAVVNQQEGIEG
jgi:2-dehydropantoate 2-reductase